MFVAPPANLLIAMNSAGAVPTPWVNRSGIVDHRSVDTRMHPAAARLDWVAVTLFTPAGYFPGPFKCPAACASWALLLEGALHRNVFNCLFFVQDYFLFA